MRPLVSVIIPTFNRKAVLNRAIDSVLKQTFKNFDLWVIDDGSSDGTAVEVGHYIKTENKGVSAARNLGVRESKGEWLAFLDSDDEWLPRKLEIQLEHIRSHPQLSIVHGEEIWIRRGKRVNQKNIHQKFGGQIFEKCLPLCLISPSAVMIRRELFEEMGGFDESFTVCEDYDLWLKITSKYEVGFVETALIMKHGGHEDQLSHKFIAMDYWRVKAMDRILKTGALSESQQMAVKDEIKKKAQILLQGYEKHNNMKDYQEIRTILDLVTLSIPGN